MVIEGVKIGDVLYRFDDHYIKVRVIGRHSVSGSLWTEQVLHTYLGVPYDTITAATADEWEAI